MTKGRASYVFTAIALQAAAVIVLIVLMIAASEKIAGAYAWAQLVPVGLCAALTAWIATQTPELRKLLVVDEKAQRLATFFDAPTDLMQFLSRACGHIHLSHFSMNGLTTWKKDMADLSGVAFGGSARRSART